MNNKNNKLMDIKMIMRIFVKINKIMNIKINFRIKIRINIRTKVIKIMDIKIMNIKIKMKTIINNKIVFK